MNRLLRRPPVRPISLPNRPRLLPRYFQTNRPFLQPRESNPFSSNKKPWTPLGRTASPRIPDAASEEELFTVKFASPRIFLPAAKVTAAALLIYGGAVYLTEKDAERWAADAAGKSPLNHLGINVKPTWRELMQARFIAARNRWQDRATKLGDTMKQFPKVVEFHTMRLFVIVANSWIWSGESKQIAYYITGLNTAIFLASLVPRWKPIMQRHFSHDILSGKSYTMLTSVFGHGSFPHLAFNSLALISFSTATCGQLLKTQAAWVDGPIRAPDWFTNIRQHLWPEATPIYHFLAFFLAAGLFSSMVSHTAKSIRLRRLMRDITSPVKGPMAMKFIDTIRPSLGASGAIYSMVTLTALAMPHTNVNILLIPIPIPITTAVGGMVLLDAIGIWRGWRMFDHWAHLGGATFGAIAYWDQGTFWSVCKALFN